MHQHQAEFGISDFLQFGVRPLNHLPEWGRSGKILYKNLTMQIKSTVDWKVVAGAVLDAALDAASLIFILVNVKEKVN